MGIDADPVADCTRSRSGTKRGVLERHELLRGEPPDAGSVVRVLIVDPHPMVARGIATGLAQFAGMQVVGTANDVVEGLSLAREFRPDVVLLEASAHDGDPTKSVQELRRLLPRGSVLVLSGRVTSALAARWLHAGASGVIDKSSDLAALARALRACAHGDTMVVAESLLPDVRRRMRDSTPTDHHLTPRERQVLALIDTGLDAAAIAGRLGIARNTARNYIQNVLMKLGAHSKLEAVAVARRAGMLPT